MTRLSRQSLEFAKNHIVKYYDSDFYPKPFEFEALWANWEEVLTHLTCNDVSGYPIEQPRTFTSIKPNGSFRVVHQLDPINTLIYTALSYEIGEGVEKARIPVCENIACSYRIEIDDKKGTLFANGSGYSGFIDKCFELAGVSKYVLVTDITDFYNQIYAHRLQNAIETADEKLYELSKDIERFILDLNSNVSQGVPVGPAASIIMAEATLIDVDNFIVDSGFKHTRYVDDIRIFGDTKQDLIRFLAKITEYLYHNHRLTLAGEKTKILKSEDFKNGYLESPEILEKQGIHDTLAAIKSFKDAYSTADVDDMDETKIRPILLSEIFDSIISDGKLDLGISRHILRRCRRYRIRSITPALFKNFKFFLPVICDVILYLQKVSNKSFVEKNKENLINLTKENFVIKFPFIKDWVEHYFVSNTYILQIDEIKEYLQKNGNFRNQAAAAYKLNSTSWVRAHKGNWPDLPPWDKRALIRAASILSKKELESWVAVIAKHSSNFTEVMTAKWVKSLKK
ncbi:MAG: RNA-directed DNA polymerase [Desulfobulbaceae bacterium]|nr:RNA-directed DNA polymerase [Desulfobulbaceae bacterium]